MSRSRHVAAVAVLAVLATVGAACEVALPDGSRLDCARQWVTETYSHRHRHAASHHVGPRHPHPGNYLHAHRRRVNKVVCTPVSGPTTTTTTTTAPTSTTTTASTTTTLPPPAGPAAVVLVGVSGVAAGGTLALDDVEVRGGASDTLYLSDNFSANLTATPQPYGTGSQPTFVTSDPAVNTSPVFSGFGVPAGVWFNPLSNPSLGTPDVVSGRLRPSTDGKLGQLLWDLTAEPVKVSFKVAVLPASSGGDQEGAGAMFIDPAALLPRAAVAVSPYGMQLSAGDMTTGQVTAAVAPSTVGAGDRVTLSRQGTVYKMWRNATLVSTVDTTEVGVLSGTVSGVGDPATCTVQGFAAGYNSGSLPGKALVAVDVAGDGTFQVPGLSSVPLKLRLQCTGDAEGTWLGGGTDSDRTGATSVTVVAGTTTPAGNVTHP